MIKFTYNIEDNAGLHARPCAEIMKIFQLFDCEGFIQKKATMQSAPLDRPIEMLSLEIACGDIVEICLEGPDEEYAKSVLYNFFSDNL